MAWITTTFGLSNSLNMHPVCIRHERCLYESHYPSQMDLLLKNWQAQQLSDSVKKLTQTPKWTYGTQRNDIFASFLRTRPGSLSSSVSIDTSVSSSGISQVVGSTTSVLSYKSAIPAGLPIT